MTAPAVVIYGCLSDKGEEESIESQIAKVRERLGHVYPDGYRVVGVFTDNGKSGLKRNRGPGLQAALDAATRAADEHGQAELWANTSARFARGSGRKDEARSLVELFTQMRRAGVALRSVHDDEMLREELVGINSRMTAKYSEDLGEAVRRAKRRQAERGEHLGGPLPDGYARDDRGEIVLDRDREEVVRGILAMALDGTPDGPIARSLNARGVTTRKGNPWTRRTVQSLVLNGFYAGLVCHGGDTFEGSHPRLIERGDWERLVAARGSRDNAKSRQHRRGRPARRHALQRLAVCGACGRRLVSFTSPYKRKDGSKQRTYRCIGYHEQNDSCPVTQFDAGLVDRHVLAALDSLLPDFEAWIASITERRSGERERLEAQLELARSERAEAARKVEAVERRYLDVMGTDDEQLVLGAVRLARQDLDDAEKRLQAAQYALDATPAEAPADALLDFAAGLQAAVRGIDTTDPMAQVNAALAEIFEGFVIHPAQHGRPVMVEPLLHLSVAQAMFSEVDGVEYLDTTGAPSMLPLLVSGEARRWAGWPRPIEIQTAPSCTSG
jgi:hypothetical protein